jgi:putative zinc finger protein
VTHPTSESLVPYALGVRDPAVAAHVAGCSTCTADVARLRDSARMLRGQTALDRQVETPECLEERAIADFVEGRLDGDAREAVVAHLLTCARCRALVVATGRLLTDPAIVRETRASGGGGRGWRRWTIPLGAVAAAGLLVFLWPRGVNDADGPSGLREPAQPGRAGPVLIVPRAGVERADRFVWSSVPGADRYRLRLHDAEGALLWSAETTDTVVTRPDSVALAPRVTYFWKVEAQTEFQRWVSSELVEFRVTGPGP